MWKIYKLILHGDGEGEARKDGFSAVLGTTRVDARFYKKTASGNRAVLTFRRDAQHTSEARDLARKFADDLSLLSVEINVAKIDEMIIAGEIHEQFLRKREQLVLRLIILLLFRARLKQEHENTIRSMKETICD